MRLDQWTAASLLLLGSVTVLVIISRVWCQRMRAPLMLVPAGRYSRVPTSLRVKREDRHGVRRTGRMPAPEADEHVLLGETRNRGPDHGHLGPVVATALLASTRTLLLPEGQFALIDHDTMRVDPADVEHQLVPGIDTSTVNQLGVAADLGVPGSRRCLAPRIPVVVPDPDRDPEHQGNRHPSAHDQIR